MSAVKRIVVAGTGSVAWLAACALRRALRHRQLEVVVTGAAPANEPRVRWTLPSLRGLHGMLGIAEPDFLRFTGATYRLGSEHRQWQGEGSAFLHAHGEIGTDLTGTPFYKLLVREIQAGRPRVPEEFSLAALAGIRGRFARPMGDERSLTASFTYGFHVEEAAYAAFLARVAAQLGVRHVAANIDEVQTGPAGIAALKLSTGEILQADLFLDCTGSRAELIGDLSADRMDWRASLPCDRMLSGFAPAAADAPALTQTIATDAGWFWRAPLARRMAVGYVYSSAHLSDDDARRSLSEAVGALEDPQVVSLSAGRRVNPWSGNCVAIGASAMQLEPLAATDLQFAALGIATLIELFPLGAASAIDAAEYNRVMAEHADGLRDFTLAHYHVGAPRTGEFWSRLRAVPLPERLAHKLDLYFSNARIQTLDFETFEETDWAWLLLGGRRVPRSLEAQIGERVEQISADQVSALRQQLENLVSTMPRHMDIVRRHLGAGS
jgi:tryptophan 7-halogenase